MLFLMIKVRVLAFGVLKDVFGAGPFEVAFRDNATVGELLAELAQAHPSAVLRGIAVSVNAEYAPSNHVLHEADEVGLLPPVSGGLDESARPSSEVGIEGAYIRLTRACIDAESLAAAAKQGEDGAIVVFDGIVRNNSRGRVTLHLDYEAYEEMALKQMGQLAEEARERFKVRQVTIVHRLGRLVIGETSVLIIVSSAHRAQAFDACRWVIDTLKKTVPIWKKETFVDGAVWADGEPFPAEIGLEATDAS